MNQINPEYIIPESFYFIFQVTKLDGIIKKNFINIFQCTEETCRFKLLNLNHIVSEDENKSISKILTPAKLHFDFVLKPSEKNYKLKYYFEAFHLIEKY